MQNIIASELTSILLSNSIVIVKYSAEWCQPCKQLARIFASKLEPQLPDRNACLVEIDIDNPDNKKHVEALHIMSVPTIMFYFKGQRVEFQDNGKTIDRIVGIIPQIVETILALIDELK